MFCKYCGAPLAPGVKFCSGCTKEQSPQAAPRHDEPRRESAPTLRAEPYPRQSYETPPAYGAPAYAPLAPYRSRLGLVAAITAAVVVTVCTGSYFLFFSGRGAAAKTQANPAITAGSAAAPTAAPSTAPTVDPEITPPASDRSDAQDITDLEGAQESMVAGGQPAALYQDAALLKFLQGEWASEVDLDGMSFAMLVHQDMYAFTMAYPRREDATLAHWRNEDYWGMEPWSWYACSAEGNLITMSDGDDFEFRYWIYVIDQDTIRLALTQVGEADWAGADYIEARRVGSPDPLDFAAYLQGRWISSIPFDEQSKSYICLTFPGDGTCLLSIARNISGSSDVSGRQIEGWEVSPYRTYSFVSTRDGFQVTFEGESDQYQVLLHGYASAVFAHAGSEENILYYRTLAH